MASASSRPNGLRLSRTVWLMRFDEPEGAQAKRHPALCADLCANQESEAGPHNNNSRAIEPAVVSVVAGPLTGAGVRTEEHRAHGQADYATRDDAEERVAAPTA